MSARGRTFDEWWPIVEQVKGNITPLFNTTKEQRIAAGIVALMESSDDPLAMLEAARLLYKKMNGYEINY